jgi:hypothetical protein
MVKKVDAVRAVIAQFGEATSAADIAAAVEDRFGILVSDAYVRVVKSRDAREGSSDIPPNSVSSRPAPVTVPALRPRAPARRPALPENTEPDQDEQQVFQLVDKCVQAIELALAGKAQQVTGLPELIAEIASVLDDDEIRRDYPGYAYDVFSDGRYKILRLYNAELPPADPVPDHNTVLVPSDPRDSTTASRPRRASKTRERECDFCEGKRQHVLSIDLYQVRGGPIGPRLIILCGMHAQAMAAAGSDVRPYRVTIPSECGVWRPEPIPYKKMLSDLAKSAADVLFGSDAEPG